ncbi:MAG: VacJ family lipoprotein [Pseudomonadales bacterium]|nr:VacJ family lipoprotein [Pseudomonadales bacterium]
MLKTPLIFLMLLGIFAPAVAAEEETNVDPLEPFNRKIHAFNDFADQKVLKPVAKGYRKVTPQFLRNRIGSVFDNLKDVNNAVNNVLQGKFKAGTSDVGRLLINTTIGLGGLWDPATRMGLGKHEEDWGQTFAVWGIPDGPYLVLPFLGPSSFRNAASRPFNSTLDPLFYLHPSDHRNTLYMIRVIDDRAGLLEAEKAVFGDKYIFYREAYLQRREYLVKDGEVSDPFAEDF